MDKTILPSGWKSVRLDYLFDRLTRKNDVGDTNVLTISAHNGLINQEDFFNKTVASEDLSNYYLLKRGDFAYNKSYSAGYNYGAFKRLTRYDSGVISPLYICFSVNDKNKCPDFYVHYFESMLLDREIKAFAQEGARNHGLLNIAIGDFFAMPIPLPPLSEQQAIAEILTTADKLIVVKERLIAAKQKQKQWLMQNLLTGKIRLPGFSGEWEKVKLGKVFDERIETNCATLELLSVTSNNGVVPRSEIKGKDNSSEDKSKYLKVCKGDITYNTMRMWQGVSALSDYEGIVSPAYTVLIPHESICANYFNYLFKLPHTVFQFFRNSQGLVDDTRNLKFNNFVKISVFSPPLPEQQAIANVLTTADREIELLKKELEQHKQIKKYLMQKLLTGKIRVKGAG